VTAKQRGTEARRLGRVPPKEDSERLALHHRSLALGSCPEMLATVSQLSRTAESVASEKADGISDTVIL